MLPTLVKMLPYLGLKKKRVTLPQWKKLPYLGEKGYPTLVKKLPYLGENVLHGHEETLAVVEAQLVVLVAATGKHPTHVRDEDGAIHAALHVTEHHRLLDLHPNRLTAVAGHIVGQLRVGTNTRVRGVQTHPLTHQYRVQTMGPEGFEPTHS